MYQSLQLTLPPEMALDEVAFQQHVIRQLHLSNTESLTIRKIKQSIDARSRHVKINVLVDVYADETPPPIIAYQKKYLDISQKPAVVIVGCGPAGMFAALRLVELGYKPILLERGKDVRARRRDLAAINKDHIVNPESNYCFGEGGAGTYSDGKLYTRSNKRGDVRRILEILVAHGATEQILYDAHPHIGTNKLPQIVADLRQSILDAGGEVHFDTKVTDFIFSSRQSVVNGKGLVLSGQKSEIENQQSAAENRQSEIRGVITADGREFTGLGVILATGHSARDIFELCQAKGVFIENKSFAVGVRIEHAQSLIDSLQYHCTDRGDYLPAASYGLVTQTHYNGVQRGVFSFCMCPGGFIVPAATAPGELVVNGMSPSRRDSRFANSGMVVAIEEVDLKPFKKFGALAGLELQKSIEQKACAITGGRQTAPAQRVLDFVKRKTSSELLETSYQPGLQSLDLREYLPGHIAEPLRQGLQDFGKKMSGYVSNEAQLIGAESRTSSPVRIPRDRDTAEHIQTKRLYPCGEGAGYAGGIMSAALDGTFVAEQLIKHYGT